MKHNWCGKFTLYFLASLALLSAIVSLVVAMFAPQPSVTMVKITPSIALVGPNATANNGSLFIGLLGSCFRAKSTDHVTCTTYSAVSPQYHIAILPNSTANKMLSPPPAFISVLICFGIVLLFIFSASYWCTVFRQWWFKEPVGKWEKSSIQFYTAWVAAVGFVVGVVCFFLVYIWFQKTIEDFNNDIVSQGEPSLIAALGPAFTMVLVAYILYALVLIVTLAKWHLPVMETKGERVDRERTEAVAKVEEEGFSRVAEMAEYVRDNVAAAAPATAAQAPSWLAGFYERFSGFLVKKSGF